MDLAAVGAVYTSQPLTPQLVAALNPDLTLADLTEDITGIGYA
ncbi:hypothetical protein [Kitasatospora sp. MMS16-BH015]|nr:hypothetical protein [Kitasatospora sp. MMS16-BH015]